MYAIKQNNRYTEVELNRHIIISLLLWTAFSVLAVFVSKYNFLLFHSFIEIFGVIVSFAIFIVAYNTHDIYGKNKFVVVGVGYGFAAAFQLVHIFIYKGMGIIQLTSANLSIQLSLISKYIEILSILAAFLFHFIYTRKTLKRSNVFIVYSVLSLLLIILIKYGVFPACIESTAGYSPTLFKVISEGFLTVILLVFLIILILRRNSSIREVLWLLLIFTFLKTSAQLLFTLYDTIYSPLNTIGHVIRFVSFYYIYKAVIETTLREPIKLVFNKLSSANKNLEIKNEQLRLEMDKKKYAEEALYASINLHRQIFELLPDGICVTNGGKINFANKSMANIMGVDSAETLVGKNKCEFVKLHPDSIEISSKRKNDIYKNGVTLPVVEQKLIRHDGAELDIEIAAVPFTEKGEMHILTVMRDISERKRIYELQKKADENARLLREAVELDKLKTEFMANISHELRTPLNVIFSSIQLLDMYSGSNNNLNAESVTKYMKLIKQNSRRLLRLINNLIDTTKIDAGFFELCLKKCNIVRIIEDITLSVAEYIKNKGINLEFDTNVEEKTVACDPDMIERIMLNLLSNAVKFTKPDGKITVSFQDKEDYVIISVKDTGIGIPLNKQEVIFERFRQVDDTLTRNHEGSGIGLSLVKSLVEMHDGQIYLTSVPKEGSEFIIELPVGKLENSIYYDNQTEYKKSKYENIDRINVEFSDIYFN